MNESDFDEFRNQLGRELHEAAGRQVDQRASGSKRNNRIRVGVVIGLLLTLLSFGAVSFLGPESVAADVFLINRQDGQIRVDVVGLVNNPESAVNQLRAEAGVTATIDAVPSPPALVGRILTVETTISEVSFEIGPTGVSEIVFDEDFRGTLSIEFGSFSDSLPETYCAVLWGRTAADTVDIVGVSANQVRFQQIGEDLALREVAGPEEVNPEYRLVEILLIDGGDTAVVLYAADPSAIPRTAECQ